MRRAVVMKETFARVFVCVLVRMGREGEDESSLSKSSACEI